ncbi:MAG TPA: glycoside hydrolase family 2 TIM barrel-domain containing protein [Kiritimatiellia bacterium]|nr:glycoside hydrolase family 2 TIM barrel-domain containing protein [Kiritimatiellia bacterium]HPS06649.1 glycoside hydrolase family 2 TIM barrel-domain containing protein [Kiritimatiellia bacterium]
MIREKDTIKRGVGLVGRLAAAVILMALTASGENTPVPAAVVSLDGPAEWRVAVDPANVGRDEKWWRAAQPEAKQVRVPGVYQEVWPGCHGAAWYWRDVVFPVNPEADGRYVLRFWQVDYLADVWVNGVHVGRHEGGEEVFTFDVTEAAQPGASNRIAVRVVCPGDEPVDGMTRLNVPQRGRACSPPPGGEYQCGGLIDSVELLVYPAIRLDDLRVRPDWKTGEIRVLATVRNAGEKAAGRLQVALAPAASGNTLAATDIAQTFAPGDTRVETVLKAGQPRLWSLSDPYLYRVTARVAADGSKGADEVSTRCGFRDFRFSDGAFRLNGKRIFLRCSHTGNTVPAPEYRIPHDPGLLRRDVVNSKTMGFNMIRFFGSVPRRYQLDLCDEIGLLVYEESAANWQWDDSPQMAERFDTAVRGMISRDRNHPSVVIWGLLNETRDGPIFRHAVAMLPHVNALDGTRLTLLNSGLEQFVPANKVPRQGFGTLCNPGENAWSDALCDSHPYQRYPHLDKQTRNLRDTPAGRPVFISEYGVGGAVDLTRQVRHYEQIGQADSEAARLYRGFLDRFMSDWRRWDMGDTFASPEDYFRLCVAQMAGMRLEGLNALRANPSCVGHSMSGTFDHGFCGEGVMTCEFRELKPGVADAVSDGFSPLRLCLFTEPKHVYRGAKVRFDAVLANEDALVPGDYPVRLQIVGPDGRSVLDTVRTATIQDPAAQPETPLAIPVFGEEVAVDGPTGKYRFLATFQKGGAAAGGNAEFYVTDPGEMPAVDADVALWGDDPALAKWLADHGFKTHPLPLDNAVRREVILVGRKPAAGDAAWRGLLRHIAQGSTAIFLSPEVFKSATNAVARVPLANKGTLGGGRWHHDWLYRHDHWAKRHPIFESLPSGGLMDYTFYRNVISDTRWAGLDAPAELAAASIDASFGYDAGVLVAVYRVGAGRIVLNTLWIVEQLGQDPVAERLLRNMLRYASSDAAKPLAELPPDFGEQQAKMGY